jgi:hypothetical protein
MNTPVISLAEQIKAKHPETGKPITIVGVDASMLSPGLIVLHRGPDGIYAEVIEYADHLIPQAA